jgi:hypothetical protein
MKLFQGKLRKPPGTFLLLLASVAFAAALGDFYFGVHKPDSQRMVALQLEILKRERSVALSSKLIAEHPKVLQRLHTNDSAVQSRLGLSDPAVELMTRQARAHHLDLELIEPGSVLTIANQRITPIVLHLSGDYTEFLDWLRELESSDVLLTVDQVTMEGSSTGRHLFSVALSTYAYVTKG